MTAGVLAVKVIPATTTPLGRRVKRWPTAVVTIAGSGGVSGEMSIVLVPIMCRTDEPREMGVLSTANPASPAAWAVLAARMWEEIKVMVWLPIVKWDSGAGGALGRMV